MSTSRRIQGLFLLICLLLGAPALAQDDGNACHIVAVRGGVNIRLGPDVNIYGIIGGLPAGASLPVLGRNADGDWYAVNYQGDEGWTAAYVVGLTGACNDIPILDAPAPSEDYERLMEIPVLPAALDPRIQGIFARGQELGKRPDAFTKIGDCNTSSPFFLMAFDVNYYDLGPYEELQPTVDYFVCWFAHNSIVGTKGWNADMMLDPLFADPEYCQVEVAETPLACEYRLVRPSVAAAMFGPNDMMNLSAAQFREALDGIVEVSLDAGVIPVLTTFTWHRDDMWEKALAFNVITAEIAEAHGLPLINLFRAAQTLPDLGLISNYTHLTDSGPNSKITFAGGEERRYGHALRNLLTLQMLDMLRVEVLE